MKRHNSEIFARMAGALVGFALVGAIVCGVGCAGESFRCNLGIYHHPDARTYADLAGAVLPRPPANEIVTLTNAHGVAKVSVVGAHVFSYVPAGGEEVLFSVRESDFMSPEFQHVGIPVVWPWFNMNGEAHTAPHGFAFRSVWKVLDETGSDDVTEVRLLLESSRETKEEWPYEFRIVYAIRLSNRLELSFSTENTGTAAFDVTEGFHPYFNVAEYTNTVIRGLDGSLIDKIDPDKPNPVQKGEVACAPGMCHVHFAPTGPVEIVDEGNGRSIFVWGRENRKVILWNPGPGFGAPELGPEDWRHIVCVEPANIQRECATRILPGRRHELRMTISSRDAAAPREADGR